MTGLPVARLRRRLQIALGAVWLLDAALQFQPFMFGRGFATEVLRPTADGNPQLVARPVLWSAQLVLAHPQLWNGVFATTQLLLALGLFWRRSVKAALAGTVVWSLIVWWLGEGLGGILTGTATPLMGAPGAVLLYAFLAVLLWPARDGAGRCPAEASIVGGVGALGWLALWGSEAYFALLPANDSPRVLHGMLAGMADGEPHALAAVDRLLARLVSHSAVGPGLGALLALCALAPFLPNRLARPLLVLAMALAALTWIGQDFGGIFTGQGTDPNSGPLLFLLALAYWPLRPGTAAPVGRLDRARRPQLRIAAAAGALVAASSLAAATGLTTSTAAAATASRTVAAHAAGQVGPGAFRASYNLAGYHVAVRDAGNRATRPGTIAVVVSRRGHALRGLHVDVRYRSLDMEMGRTGFALAPRGGGRYAAAAPHLRMGGRWQITISITVPGTARRLQLDLTDLVAL